jgi:hypothetical protein
VTLTSFFMGAPLGLVVVRDTSITRAERPPYGA